MSHNSPALAAWKKLSKMPGGKWLFSRFVSMRAPYFGSIGAQFVELRSGYCELNLKKRRRVLNHIGTMHANAMCNMAELAAGTIADVSIPPTHRWIPKGMTVEYLAKEETDLRAIIKLDPIPDVAAAVELPFTVDVTDSNATQVFPAVIRIWILPLSAGRSRSLNIGGTSMTAKRATTVDQYIESAPGKAQPHLRKLRELLQRAAPKAQETIKWGNPFFIEPRFLFAYSAHKNHVSFAPSPESLEAFRDQLATHDTTRNFLKIRYAEPLPEMLIRKIAKHRFKAVKERDDDNFW